MQSPVPGPDATLTSTVKMEACEHPCMLEEAAPPRAPEHPPGYVHYTCTEVEAEYSEEEDAEEDAEDAEEDAEDDAEDDASNAEDDASNAGAESTALGTELSVVACVSLVREAVAVPPARPQRQCAQRTITRIQETLDWENCDESSARFQAVAQRLDEAFDKERLEDAEMEEVVDSSDDSSSVYSDDDDSYESSFVTDGSGSEEEGESDDEWQPKKKPRVCAARPIEEAGDAGEAEEVVAGGEASEAGAASAAGDTEEETAEPAETWCCADAETAMSSAPPAVEDAVALCSETDKEAAAICDFYQPLTPVPSSTEQHEDAGFYSLWVL